MKFAIIAAGEGSRLAAEGIDAPKPLVQLHGEALIDRLIRIFMQHDPEEIVVICNDRTTLVAQHLNELQRDGIKGRPVPLRFLVKSTPSSMHSFYEISKWLSDGPFILTTVDTIFREQEFADYVKAFEQTTGDGLMGVTSYVDDEKPLWVGTDTDMRITGFFDASDTCTYISAGIYGLHSNTIATLHQCIEHGESRMRNFQRALITDGRTLQAYSFNQVFDIDHASDLHKAEQYV
jgi:NDP-sugar pyrophosphorylase family protein